MYQADMIFVCFELYSDFASLSTIKEKFKASANIKEPHKKKKKAKKSKELASFMSSILRYMSC
jgi:hypothetical protein